MIKVLSVVFNPMSTQQAFQVAGVDGCKAGWLVAVVSVIEVNTVANTTMGTFSTNRAVLKRKDTRRSGSARSSGTIPRSTGCRGGMPTLSRPTCRTDSAGVACDLHAGHNQKQPEWGDFLLPVPGVISALILRSPLFHVSEHTQRA